VPIVDEALCGGLLLLAALIGWLAGGGPAALGAAAGVLLVTLSYVASTLAIAWADTVAPRMVFPVGMAMYVTKFSLFGALLIFVGATDWAGVIPMAIGIIAGVGRVDRYPDLVDGPPQPPLASSHVACPGFGRSWHPTAVWTAQECQDLRRPYRRRG